MNILIADNQPLVYETVNAIVHSVVEDARVHWARTIQSVTSVCSAEVRVDLVIMELTFPACLGLDALLQFRESFPAIPVIVLSSQDDPMLIHGALRAGAIGFIPKTLPTRVVAAALNLVAAGGIYVPVEALRLGADAGSPADERRAGPKRQLTDRQFEVLQLIERGLDNRTIARRLKISEGTVKQHVHSVFGILGVTSRTAAIATASRRGMFHHPGAENQI